MPDQPDQLEVTYQAFALEAPKITVIADEALRPGEADADRFDLRRQAGSVYDILRHPRTNTPLAVAIYGDWGAGKTTTMRWMESLLLEWNKDEREGGVRVWPVWFYPWKYQTREDVWRGIISEVILESTRVSRECRGKIATAARRFGPFLGRSFLAALKHMSFEFGVGAVADGKATVDGAIFEDVYQEYEKTGQPERGYLNEFERALEEWVSEALGVRIPGKTITDSTRCRSGFPRMPIADHPRLADWRHADLRNPQ